jgi:hypothetical protein
MENERYTMTTIDTLNSDRIANYQVKGQYNLTKAKGAAIRDSGEWSNVFAIYDTRRREVVYLAYGGVLYKPAPEDVPVKRE